MFNSKKSTLICFFLLTVLCGIVIHLPYHNFQSFVSQGDHGRDLYAAAAVLRGEMPYKDFWWVYGPLMPYYYGLFFKIFGIHVPSILLGKMILNIGAGLCIFMAVTRFFSPIAGFVAGLWFLVYHADFFFTYNHAGGILLLVAAIWMHWSYIKTQQFKYAALSLLIVGALGLVKINFAITTLIMGILTILITRRLNNKSIDTGEKTFYALSILGLPLFWFGIYSIFVQGLTINEIRQCLPYLGGDEPYNNLGPLQTIPQLITIILNNIRSTWISFGLCVLILLSTMKTLLDLTKSKDKTLMLIIGYALLFYAFNLHEFIKSGVFYRMFWSQPFTVLLTFIMIASAIQSLAKPIRFIVWSVLCVIAATSAWQTTTFINSYKTPAHYLGSSRGQVYITNDSNWLQTVVLTTKQLNINFKKDELFLALPYDCLYYYLTDKKTPTRQLIFFDHIKIPLEQEGRIIQSLEQQKIAGVLLSSRHSAKEPGLGTMGVTYCPMMAQYINTNFTPYAKIGDWINEPGWAWNHGTYIFKRKEVPHE